MAEALGHERNDTIDAFRGVAILSVLAYHYAGSPADPRVWHTAAPNVGRFGVQLFFIISGIVISMTVRSAAGRPLEFLVKRVARLYPAYLVAMVSTTAILMLARSSTFPHDLGRVASTILLYDGRQPFIDPSYWSLVPELKFYLAVALCMAVFRKRYWAGLIALTLAGLFVSVVWNGEIADRYLVAEYMPLFLLGVSTWMIIYERARSGWLCAGVALVALPYAALRFDVAFHPHWLMLVYIGGLGGLLILLLALRVKTSLGPLAWLGRRSYSLYLLHQALGLTALSLLERHGLPAGLALPVVATGAVGLATLSFRFIEEPGRRATIGLYRHLQGRSPPAPSHPASAQTT